MARVDTIIQNFELEVNDITELSTAEELMILNRIYARICQAPFEFLKKTASGSILTDSTSSYITLPSDFQYFYENAGFTENNIEYQGNVKPKVIFVGTTLNPYKVINFSDRRQYKDQDNYAYIDYADNKVRFTKTPSATTYEFDYIKIPTTLIAGADPIFPERFDDLIVYGMAGENEILQRSDKARSYRKEYIDRYNSRMSDIKWWNAQLINY